MTRCERVKLFAAGVALLFAASHASAEVHEISAEITHFGLYEGTVGGTSNAP